MSSLVTEGLGKLHGRKGKVQHGASTGKSEWVIETWVDQQHTVAVGGCASPQAYDMPLQARSMPTATSS